MDLQRRNNLSTRERFQGSNPRRLLVLLGISNEFLFCNNFNDHKMHFIRTRNIFPHSRESFPCRVTFILHVQRYPFGKKFLSSIWISIKNFSEARSFLCVLGYDSGDKQAR